MLKLFCSVMPDHQAWRNPNLLQHSVRPRSSLWRVFASPRVAETRMASVTSKLFFDNEVTLRFILEKADLFFPTLEFQKNVPLILITEQALDIANSLIAKGIIPAKAAEDALHIAYCHSQCG